MPLTALSFAPFPFPSLLAVSAGAEIGSLGRRGDCSPRPPQIRTCRFPASGSSDIRFAGPTCAICRSRGDEVRGICVPPSVPFGSSYARSTRPRHCHRADGSRGPRFAAFTGIMVLCDSRYSVSMDSGCPRPSIPRVRSDGLLPMGRDRSALRPGHLFSRFSVSIRRLPRGEQWVSHVPGLPS